MSKTPEMLFLCRNIRKNFAQCDCSKNVENVEKNYFQHRVCKISRWKSKKMLKFFHIVNDVVNLIIQRRILFESFAEFFNIVHNC